MVPGPVLATKCWRIAYCYSCFTNIKFRKNGSDFGFGYVKVCYCRLSNRNVLELEEFFS